MAFRDMKSAMLPIEEMMQQAVHLPLQQRLVLARALLDVKPDAQVEETQSAWDDEIRARVAAIDAGQVVGIPLEDIKREMERRFSA